MNYVLNYFLYFPEDKSTYIPAFIELALIIIAVYFLIRWLRKNSAKHEAEAKRLEERALAERDERQKQSQL